MPDLLPLRDEWFENHPLMASRKTYERHLRTFIDYCLANGVKDVSRIDDSFLMKYPPALLKRYATATCNIKVVVLKDFLVYLSEKKLVSVNWARMERYWRRLPKAKRMKTELDEDGIEQMVEYCMTARPQNIIDARNLAFIIFLADTGLRVHEACKLKRGDIDWQKMKGGIVGKGSKPAKFRVSDRAAQLVKRYLNMRLKQDGAQNIPLYRLPIFARHDDGAGKHVLHMTPTTGRNITADMVMLVLGEQADPQKPITPHKFRHFLIDRARRQGGIMLAKGLARHESIKTTEGYFHMDDEELDKGYREMFNRTRVQ